jgi:hypothetical protein
MTIKIAFDVELEGKHVNRAPLLLDENEEIACEQRRGSALRLNEGQEHLKAASSNALGGEPLALWQAANDTPES